MLVLPESGTQWRVDPTAAETPHGGVVVKTRLREGGGWDVDDLSTLPPGEGVTVLGLHLRGRDWDCYARCSSPSRGELLVPLHQFGPGGWMRRVGERGGEG